MKSYQVILLGLFSWAIHEVASHVIEGIPLEFRYEYDDNMVILRPTINLIYNGSFHQPLSQEEMNRIPQPLQKVLKKASNDGLCLPREGVYPAHGLLIFGPAVLLTDWLSLEPDQFEMLLILYFKIIGLLVCISLFHIVSLLFYFIGNRAYFSIIFAVILPPQVYYYFSFGQESYVIFSLIFLIFSITYFLKNVIYLSFLALFFAVCAYFSKYRAAPLIFILPLALLITKRNRDNIKIKYSAIFFMLLIWLVPQLLWSWHVYRYTCKWVLTSPSEIFSAVLCDNNKEDICFTPSYTYNYVRVSWGRLEALIGYPHSIQYHPKSLMLCISSRSMENKIELFDCIPEWIYDDFLTRDRWISAITNTHIFYTKNLTLFEQIKIGKEIVSELEAIIAHLKNKYWWLPLYRAYRVLIDNIFHPIPHKGMGRGRFPAWTKVLYFGYHSAYIGIAFILGFISSLYWLLQWIRKRLSTDEKFIGIIFLFSGWGFVAIPVITGHSELRYFYLSAVLFMIISPYFLCRGLCCTNWVGKVIRRR